MEYNLTQLLAKINLVFGSNVDPESLRDLLLDMSGIIDIVHSSGLIPEHEWDGTSIRFQNSDGSWGPYRELKGDSGATLQFNAVADAAVDEKTALIIAPSGGIKKRTLLIDNTSDADKPVSTAQATALELKINSNKIGAASGVAPLDSNSLVPSAYLPSYVDDVLEFANLAAFPSVGESGKIFIALDTLLQYRWTGSVYSKITTGEVSSVNGRKGVIVLTKSDAGLDQVDNTSDVNKPISTFQQNALNLKFDKSGTYYIGTTSIPLNRASAAQTLCGVNIDGSANKLALTQDSGMDVDMYPIFTNFLDMSYGGRINSDLKYHPSTGVLTAKGFAKTGGTRNQGLLADGSVTSNPVIIISNYSVLPTDDIIISNSATNITISLPVPVGANRKITFKNIGTGKVSLVVFGGGGNLDDNTAYYLYQWDSVNVLDNSGKYLIL